MLFDAVLCVGPQHREIAVRAIRSVRLFTGARKIFVITSRAHFPGLRRDLGSLGPDVQLVDEDGVISGVDLARIRELCSARQVPAIRPGWYFQQFLKFGVSALPDLAEFYLVWDCDTIALQPLEFFADDGRVLVNPQRENHRPYFTVLSALLGLSRQADFSFIAEHIVMRKTYVQELLADLRARASVDAPWPDIILAAISDEDLAFSGFSEFETYGNWVLAHYPNHFAMRSLQSLRNGGRRCGVLPGRADLFVLMLSGQAYATFEVWDQHPRKFKRICRIGCTRLWTTLNRGLGRGGVRWALAGKIAG